VDISWRTHLAVPLARSPKLVALLHRGARGLSGRHHVAATAVVLDGDEVVVAEHRFRGGSWALPSGWLHRHEDPHRAAEREVREELGLAVRAVEIVACERHGAGPEPLEYSGISLAFRCAIVPPFGRLLRPSVELTTARWLPIPRAVRLLSEFERAAVLTAQRRAADV
jgi:8-oxo-dGTP pyrophosphatase MutT (NUDIX family)